MKRWRAVAVGVMLLTLAGCTIGPRYQRPAAPPADSYKETKDWKIAKPGDQTLRGAWWSVFHDPVLDGLEQQLLAANQDIKTAEAHFRAARTAIRFARAGQAPTVTAGASIDSLRTSANRPFTPPLSSHTSGDFVLPFDLSYELDVWGRVRRTIAAAREEAQAASADLDAVRLSLEAELAFDYYDVRSADAQTRLLDDTVKAYEAALQLTRNRFEGGAAPESDVAQAEAQLEAARTQDTDIGVVRAQAEHAIAILAGQAPEKFSLPAAPLEGQPPDIPVGVPSELLQRRPDIAAFERRMAEANEAIGLARIAYYPSLSLSAAAGLEGSSITNWLNWPSRFWAVGPSALLTVFEAGRRRAASERAAANYDAVVAQYRQATLEAFRQVEDNLAALRILEKEAEQQRAAVRAAKRSLELFTIRYTGGVDSYLQVVTAQTVALANERNENDILRRRLEASVLLVKALGGGWDVAQMPTL